MAWVHWGSLSCEARSLYCCDAVSLEELEICEQEMAWQERAVEPCTRNPHIECVRSDICRPMSFGRSTSGVECITMLLQLERSSSGLAVEEAVTSSLPTWI